MDDLVQRLAEGTHPVETSRYHSVEELKQAIDRGYVLIKFTDTQGGTELGLRLDRTLTNLDRADFTQATGVAQVVGQLTLNYVKVRGVADIDLSTLCGNGHLEILEA